MWAPPGSAPLAPAPLRVTALSIQQLTRESPLRDPVVQLKLPLWTCCGAQESSRGRPGMLALSAECILEDFLWPWCHGREGLGAALQGV